MNWERQIAKIIVLLLAVVAFGVTGFITIEGWSFLDALYMTVITLSTVGFNEVHPLTPRGRVFVIVLTVIGVGAFFYIITGIAEFIVAGHFAGAIGRIRMKKEIDRLKNHYIVCGFGRVGQQVCTELERDGEPFVVVDNNRSSIERCRSFGYLHIEGDASNDETLKEAGVLRARGLVTATDSDADNVFVTLSAKSLRSDIFVVARANLDDSERKLKKAGADRVISPYAIGGRRLASLLLRPAVVEFLDVVMHSEKIELIMEEVYIHKRSPFVGITMKSARQRCLTGANILAIKKKGELIVDPSSDVVIESGDRLVALGTREQIKDLEGMT